MEVVGDAGLVEDERGGERWCSSLFFSSPSASSSPFSSFMRITSSSSSWGIVDGGEGV